MRVGRYRSVRSLASVGAMLIILWNCLWAMPACSGEKPPKKAEVVLSAMLESLPSYPTGQIYARTADAASASYLRSSLFAALYGPTGRGWLGEDAMPGETTLSVPEADMTAVTAEVSVGTLISDGAIYLSNVMHPFELGVFRCADLDGALSVAALCQTRLNLLRAAWQGTVTTDEEAQRFLEHATVTVDGCYVFLIVSDQPEVLLDAARRVMRS